MMLDALTFIMRSLAFFHGRLQAFDKVQALREACMGQMQWRRVSVKFTKELQLFLLLDSVFKDCGRTAGTARFEL